MTAADTARRPGAPRAGLRARYPLVSFFILAYAGSWLVELPYVRFADGAGLLPLSWPIPFAVSAAVAPFAGPFLAAFIMAVGDPATGIVTWNREFLRRSYSGALLFDNVGGETQ
jgi:hypothetical protein